MKEMTIEQFQAAIKAQGVSRVEHVAFICPMCKTIQSANDLITAGAGNNMDEVEKFVAFSCIGRWTSAPAPRNTPDGKPCNWTLGGLFKLHDLEVVTEDGKHHPRFALATPEQAKGHEVRAS